MPEKQTLAPESTAARVALWRALHLQIDAAPHVFEDELGLKLLNPEEGWEKRGDMHPQGTAPFRASIVARSRFIEDLVTEKQAQGVSQYVILGAGIDTFAQRKPHIATQMTVFEVDQKAPQEWKKQRLQELGFSSPSWLKFVGVDFDSGEDWWRRLCDADFDTDKTAIFASAGVSMYLTKDATLATMRQVAALAPESLLVMSFLLPLEMVEEEHKIGVERSIEGAKASGTPFISFYTPEELLAMGREAGFRNVEHISADELTKRYFATRTDGLRPPKNCEEILVAIS